MAKNKDDGKKDPIAGDLNKIRKDDDDLDKAGRGKKSNDPTLDLLGKWARETREGE